MLNALLNSKPAINGVFFSHEALKPYHRVGRKGNGDVQVPLVCFSVDGLACDKCQTFDLTKCIDKNYSFEGPHAILHSEKFSHLLAGGMER